MIFRPKLAEAILAGRKTETRRPAKFEQVDAGTANEHSRWLPCRYKPGKTYAIQPGRGKKGIGRLRVLEVRNGYMHELDDGAIRAEGFSSRAEFERVWREIYGRGSYLDSGVRHPF